MSKEKIAEIVKRIQLGLCPENRHYDCNVCTYSCSECWTKTIEALIEQEILKLDNAYATMFQEQQDKEKAMRDALVTARGIAMEQEEDWIAVERTYLPERIIPFRDIQVVLDAVLEEAMSKEMMICPKAKECGIKARVSAEWRVKNLEPHCEPHEWKISCDSEDTTHHCPACIRYIPEQPKKPVEPTCPARHWDNECSCGHLRIHHTDWTGKCHCCDEGENPCKCKSFTPADLQPEPFKRYMKYEVMKLDDIKKYLTPNQKTNLEDIIRTLQDGRSKDGKVPCNSYVVVKEGLPYTEQVWKLIKDYETEPERQVSRDFDTIEHEAEMPLIDSINKVLWHLHLHCMIPLDKGECVRCEKGLADILKALEAHDSAVAAKARAEFADMIEPILLKLWQESNKAKEEISSRRWITDGRGSYKYDDEKYRKEAGLAFDAIYSNIDAMQKSLQEIDKVAHIRAMAGKE